MGKISPITFNKNRPMSESVHEREIAQIRGLLGSVQWPAVQSSPHLQCTTSMLSGQSTKATVQTLHECNKDVGLTYNYIGEPQDLRLITFFDAGFTARPDGNSQGGYITLLVNQSLLTSSEEGEYHVINWRSFKTPRAARSSLGAEAQAGGQAADSVDFTRRFWQHLLQPSLRLQDLIEAKSTLKPVLVTDAKALYDSYHREGISSSLIDKRVSLEIRVMKERMECLGGSLRWMSSERQIADGLTKESARSLLASRLRHGRLKLTWGPSYTAAKKKTKAQRIEAIKESTTNFEQPPGQEAMREEWNMEDEHPLTEHEVTAKSHTSQNEHQAEYDQELCEFVHYTRNVKPLVYVLSSSHVASRMHPMDLSRMKNVMFFMVCFLWFLLQGRKTHAPKCRWRSPPKSPTTCPFGFWF